MSGEFFVDSNIWLYAFMDDTSPKHARALQIIDGIECGVRLHCRRYLPFQRTW